MHKIILPQEIRTFLSHCVKCQWGSRDTSKYPYYPISTSHNLHVGPLCICRYCRTRAVLWGSLHCIMAW